MYSYLSPALSSNFNPDYKRDPFPQLKADATKHFDDLLFCDSYFAVGFGGAS
jgi:hypothetical protein